METKYVILMHNAEDHSFSESPLLDSYPKPDVIDYYLSQSKFAFAKVEKRYSNQDIEKMHKKINAPSATHQVLYMDDCHELNYFGTASMDEFNLFIKKIEQAEYAYQL